MLIGMLAWAIRYLMFAFTDGIVNHWMLYAAIVLHGICYDFFFVSGQIYIDKKAEKSFRNAAQGLITFATYGVGMLIGSYVSGWVTQGFVDATDLSAGYDWKSVWLVPATIALTTAILFILLFKEKTIEKKRQ